MEEKRRTSKRVPAASSNIRFGPYELDLRSGELRKNGVRIRLQEQPFQILVALLERPGEVVLREEIRNRLWPDETVVEFDQGINAAVKRLRGALCDSTEKPRYIETLARRGYRFIGQIEEVDGGLGGAIVSPVQATQPSIDGDPDNLAALGNSALVDAAVAPPSAREARSKTGPRRLFLTLAGLVLLLAASLVSISRWKRTEGSPALQSAPFTYYQGEESSPSFSPDGRQVAFHWNGPKQDNFDIYVKTVGSNAGPVRMTTDPRRDLQPTWSPDGRQIAFVRESEAGDSRRGDLMVLPVLKGGGPERKLTSFDYLLAPAPDRLAIRDRIAWSPDSRMIVFSTGISGETPNGIWTVSLDTAEVNRITVSSLSDLVDCCPVFLQDGHSIAFLRSGYPKGQLMVLPLSATGMASGPPRPVARLEGISPAGLGRFPQSGDFLYLIWEPEQNAARVFRTLGDGGPSTQVQSVPYAKSFSFAKEGARFAWSHAATHWGLYRFDLTTKIASRFATSMGSDGEAQFSPDNSRVVFTSNRSGTWEIWVCDNQGAGCHALTEAGGSPSWSKDGREIAFDRLIGGNLNIFVVSAQGGSPRRVTAGVSDSARPSWSGDGKSIYFACNGSGAWQICKIPAKGGPKEQITRNGGFEAIESADGTTLYYTKRVTPGIWKVPAKGGMEELATSFGREGMWTVAPGGFYLFTTKRPDEQSVDYFDSSTDTLRRVASLPDSLGTITRNRAFDVSSDRRFVLYNRLESDGEDIMVADNFR